MTRPTLQDGLISGDDHIDLCYLPPDLWQSRVPAKWREEAPRVVALEGGATVWVKEGRVWGIWGSKHAAGQKEPFEAVGLSEEVEPGVFRTSEAKYRLGDMDRDGLYAQVMYNFLNWVFEDQELKSVCVAAFNSWLAEFCSTDPNRLIGLAVLPSHDTQQAIDELHRSIEMGLRGAQFDAFGATVPIFDPAWDPLWAEASQSAAAISVHIGHSGPLPPRTELAAPARHDTWELPARAAIFCLRMGQVLADVTMSGMLERHPRLKFVLGESSIGWIPFALERLDYECEQYRDLARDLPSMKPSEQFRRNIYCTFQDEEIGVSLIPYLGEDNVMWAADYPHGDGSFPYSADIVDRIFKGQTETMKRKVTRDNAISLYGIE